MKNTKKLLSLLLIFVTAAAFLPACSSDAAPEISSPALVSKVTKYEIDYSKDDKPWVEQHSFEYEYKDAYPVSLTETELGETFVTDFKYTFKDGIPVSMELTNPFTENTLKTGYTKKGLVNRVKTYDTTGRKIGEQVFQYGNRDEYFTLVLHENIISPPEEKVVDHMEEIDSVMITSENGLLRKTVNDGLFANFNDKEEKIWHRFNGTYTANYDENGIIDYTTALFKSFPGSGKQLKFDLTVEDGRVTEAIVSNWYAADPAKGAEATDATAGGAEDSSADNADSDANDAAVDTSGSDEGSWEPDTKYVFEYSDQEISPARYASMINYFLMEGGGNYYIYNWY